MKYPPNDNQFEEKSVSKVKRNGKGWAITDSEGWTLFVDKCPFPPKTGMIARYYGAGIGSRVRGLFLNGKKVFYRTAAEDHEQAEIELFGADAVDWLARWDAGKTVWSIEMGGLGPGYEQCIQITTAEILRHIINSKPKMPAVGSQEDCIRYRNQIDKLTESNKRIKKLGLSGAQFGAALHLATQLYQRGPRAVIRHKEVENRQIQVSRRFP